MANKPNVRVVAYDKGEAPAPDSPYKAGEAYKSAHLSVDVPFVTKNGERACRRYGMTTLFKTASKAELLAVADAMEDIPDRIRAYVKRGYLNAPTKDAPKADAPDAIDPKEWAAFQAFRKMVRASEGA